MVGKTGLSGGPVCSSWLLIFPNNSAVIVAFVCFHKCIMFLLFTKANPQLFNMLTGSQDLRAESY